LSEQLSMSERAWPCDCCVRGVETDPVTGIKFRCRVCGGTGTLDHDPADVAAHGPFYGLAEA
jgi:hypothetical protein